MILLKLSIYPLLSALFVSLALMALGGISSDSGNWVVDFPTFALFILMPSSLCMGVAGGIHLVVLHLPNDRNQKKLAALSMKTGIVIGAGLLLLLAGNKGAFLFFGIPAFLTAVVAGWVFGRWKTAEESSSFGG